MARMDGARGGNREKERPISDFEFASAGQIYGVITLQKTEKTTPEFVTNLTSVI